MLSRELQLLQKRFEALYMQISDLLVDAHAPDQYGMPSIRADSAVRVKRYIDSLTTCRANTKNMPEIISLARILEGLAKLLQPASLEKVKAGEQNLFVKSFACTLALYRELNYIEEENSKGDQLQNNWHLIFAPRIISIGNLMSALNLYKQPEGKVSKSWKRMRSGIKRNISDPSTIQ